MSVADYYYILSHGLNVYPSAMERLAEALALPPEDCAYIHLPGHAEGESLQKLMADRWLDSFCEQYLRAVDAHPDILFIGYSLSGLLMTYLLGQERIPPPRKQVLLAPALAFKQWTKIPAYIKATLLDWLLIPSLTPRRYKANPGVTLGAYKVLFRISQELDQLDPVTYNLPTLVLCDQRDELVDPQGLQTFIREKELSQWQPHILPSGLWDRWGKKHLLVAREYQSDTYWNQIEQRIDDFINA